MRNDLFARSHVPTFQRSNVSTFQRGNVPTIQRALPGPDDVLRTTLPNGIVVLVRENWSAPSIVMEGYLHVGNLDEPAHLTGLTSYTSSMLSRGA
ncbi:MAG: hypothetical protein M1482_06470, partial [Chloroflexi bacterium]|nr:hypothetical protein [Chloroflexota bacterium]